MPEQWKAIPGFEGKYEASTMGRVRSLTASRGIRKTPRVKKLTTDKDGYLHVGLCVGVGAKSINFVVGRLILMTFDRLPKFKEEAAHNNGNPTDNKLGNLRWATKSENEQDKFLHGTAPVGENCYRATITDTQARKVKELIRTGVKRSEIITITGCSLAVYKNILRGSSWKHLK